MPPSASAKDPSAQTLFSVYKVRPYYTPYLKFESSQPCTLSGTEISTYPATEKLCYNIHAVKPTVLIFQSSKDKSWRSKLEGMSIYSRSAGWHMHVIECDTRPRDIREMIQRLAPVGCIVERAMTLARNPVLSHSGIPAVYLDQNPDTARPHTAMVVNDSAAFARLAAMELLKSGVRNFTYVPYKTPTSWCKARQKAFETAIRKAKRHFVRWTGSLTDLPRPCGILCAEDSVAQEKMEEANRLGLRIPQDLLFVGIDNDPLICENTTPPLTSVMPDFKSAGYMAAKMLAELIVRPRTRRSCVKYGPAALLVRESSSRNIAYDTRATKALTYIAEHVFEPKLLTDDIAAAMGCSRRLADLIFRKELGHSMREHILDLRYAKACDLLRSGTTALSDIPILCGYESRNFFMRMFKRKSGVTMREWRRGPRVSGTAGGVKVVGLF